MQPRCAVLCSVIRAACAAQHDVLHVYVLVCCNVSGYGVRKLAGRRCQLFLHKPCVCFMLVDLLLRDRCV